MKKNTRIRRRKYNSRKKYIFPLACLSILLVVSVAGVFAGVGETFTDNGIKYKITDETTKDGDITGGTVSIVGYEGTSTEIGVPAAVDYKPASGASAAVTYKVTNIGKEAFLGSELKSINFDKAANLEVIEGSAFKGCTNLEKLDFSKATSLYWFKSGAFSKCGTLKSVILPASLQKIGDNAFSNCVNLQSVEFSKKISDLTIGKNAFNSCSLLTEFPDLSESAATITDGAFIGCHYLDANPDDNAIFPANSKPFGDKLVNKFKLQLYKTSFEKMLPDGVTDAPEGVNIPENIFKDMNYSITFKAPEAGYSLKGLGFLETADSKIPEPYTIDKKFTPIDDNTYSFNMPDASEVYLYAMTTKGDATSGAPTITTDKLKDGTKGQKYEDQLTADSSTTVKWSVETENGSPATLPDGLKLTSDGKITGTATKAGTYEFIFVAENDVSAHKKQLTLKIFDNKLSDFGRNDLWWEENGDNVSIAWEPLTAGSGETIDYTIKIYNDRNQEVGSFEKTLTGAYTSSFANEDVTDILAAAGKGTYYFTITAESNTYGSSFASSKNSAKGTYPYGYEKYTITATVSGSGTGKVSLSNASYNIPGIDANPLTNGVKVTVLENSITETTPLTFLFTPDKGCEVTKLTVNGNAITKNMESYTIKSIDEIPAANTSGSTGSNSSGNSGTSGGTSGSDSGVLVASERSTTLNASGTNSGSLDILAEFGLVSNNIDGNIILDGSYVQGEKASFEAYGDGMNDVPVVDGVTRWVPKYWWLDDEKKAEGTTTHSWTSDPYSDAIDTTNLSLGTHTLYVAFQKQNYVGSTGQWVDAPTVNSTDIRAADFVVTDKTGNTEDPDKESDKDSSTKGDKDSNKNTNSDKKDNTSKDKNTGKGSSSGSGTGSVVDRVTSTLSNVATGDDMTMALWIALALVSLIGIGFCVRQIIKH